MFTLVLNISLGQGEINFWSQQTKGFPALTIFYNIVTLPNTQQIWKKK